MARELKPCGTRAAYERHLFHGEEPCDPCKAANSRKSLPRARARQRALNALARRHPEEFALLYADKKAEEGLS